MQKVRKEVPNLIAPAGHVKLLHAAARVVTGCAISGIRGTLMEIGPQATCPSMASPSILKVNASTNLDIESDAMKSFGVTPPKGAILVCSMVALDGNIEATFEGRSGPAAVTMASPTAAASMTTSVVFDISASWFTLESNIFISIAKLSQHLLQS
jgi:hypothetical protein